MELNGTYQLLIDGGYFDLIVDSGSVVPAAWRILGLRMEKASR
jgi:hypothetical protein